MLNPEHIAEQLGGASKRGWGWMCKCPCHDDKESSLSVYEQGGALRFKCFAGCSEESVQKKLSFNNIEQKPVVYDYRDENGTVLYHKLRTPGTGGKDSHRCMAPDGSGSVRDIRKVLYNTHLIAQWPKDEPILVVEGEKDVDICTEHNICAVCNFDGAGKWLAEYSEQLRGRHLLVVPDYDQPGAEHAELVFEKTNKIAASVAVLDTKELFSSIGVTKLWKGADIHDWFLRGGTGPHLKQLIRKRTELQDAADMTLVMREALTIVDRKSRADEELSGLETGFTELDKITDGLQPADLIILAARPSVGKTALALNIAEKAMEDNKNILFFSMEMGAKQLGARLLYSMTNLDNRARELTEQDWRALEDAASRVVESGLIIDDTTPLTISKLQSRARLYNRQQPIDLILVDYIQYMKGEGESTREREIAAVSQGLKTLAKELDCPVVALAQLNRGVEYRKSARPFLSDLRDSGSIEQDADLVLLMWPDRNAGIRNLQVAKNRNGPVGEFQLVFDASQTRFIERRKPERRVETPKPELEGMLLEDDFLI